MAELTNEQLADALMQLSLRLEIEAGLRLHQPVLRDAAERLRKPLQFRWEDIFGGGMCFEAVLGVVTEDLEGGWHASVFRDGDYRDLEGLWNTKEDAKAAFTSQVTGGGR